MRFFLIALALFSFSCASAPTEPKPSVETKKIDTFFDAFSVTNVIALDKASQQYLTRIDKAIVDPDSGHIFVGDFKDNQVIRIDQNGRLQHVYVVDGVGPGELQHVREIMWADQVLTIFGLSKVVMFTVEGDLVFERNFTSSDDLVALQHGVVCGDYFYGIKSRGQTFVVQSDTTVKDVIHFRDNRLDLINFPPTAPIACFDGAVFIADAFDLKLYQYGSETKVHSIGASDIDFSGLTANNPNPASQMELVSKKLKSVNRWETVHGLKSALFLVRMNFANRGSYPTFYFPDTREVIEFGPIQFMRTRADDTKPFTVHEIVGTEGDALIGAQWDEESLEYMKGRIDGISDPTSPHLLFFQLRPELAGAHLLRADVSTNL